MSDTNITSFRKNVFGYVDQAVTYGDVIRISTKNGNAVMLSEADYNALLETLHLCAIPGMADSIKAADAQPLEDCALYDPDEAW
jgi:PHD/YefM family antitoxin component YafN of YafNO toxin-antitoxin module